MKPKFANIDAMETAAVREADETANLRLRAPIARPAKTRWLTVLHIGYGFFTYYEKEGRKVANLTRAEAAAVLAREWEYAE
jgi:hypothetical protein